MTDQTQAQPEDVMLKKILEEIKRYDKNQIEFKEAIDDFILTSNKILDT